MTASARRAHSIPIPDHGRLYINLQPEFLTISEDLHHTYAFDREGRLLSAFVAGVNYRRGLGGDILLKQASPWDGL
ncbi:MAG: hypothetical protein HGA65_06740, partial [Oscillochloris sp.]|nr:hypothetical protein [Oscillochloris sp.]